MPWIFLSVSVLGALMTLNTYHPIRRGFPAIPSFFAGWLTSELPMHTVAWQSVATGLFVWAGSLAEWPGMLGLAICAASWAVLARLVPLSHRAGEVAEEALTEALGSGYRDALPGAVADRFDEESAPAVSALPFRFDRTHIRVDRDIPYVDDGDPRHMLDVYSPREPVTGAPVLFQAHGGAWTIGNKREQALPLIHRLAERGWVCVTANYRLSPKATFPDHLIDLKRALHWVRENVERWGGDPGFIAATGGSAGGHLSAMLGLTEGEPEYQPGFESADTSIQACVPFYGVYDFHNELDLPSMDGLRTFLEHIVIKQSPDVAGDLYRRSSPLNRVHPEAPPFFVIHGELDGLAAVEQARSFATALREASTEPVAYAEIPGAQHAFEIFNSVRCEHTVRAVERFLSWAHARHNGEWRTETG